MDPRGEALALSPTAIETMVRGASILDLVRYLPARSDWELDVWDGFRSVYGSDRFACPHCQLPADRPTTGWLGAIVVDSVFWACSMCGTRGTRWEIVTAILENAESLSDFLADEVPHAS